MGDPHPAILAVAGRLFAERGVAGTTMAEIARRSGLQQSSLYYYFRNKEHVLDEMIAEANRAPLELIERVRGDGGTAAVQLYRLIRADVAVLCTLPYDLNEIHRLAGRDPKSFARYWRDRERLVEGVTGVIADGVAAGDLRPVDPRLTALTVLSNDEATQNWLRSGESRPASSQSGSSGPHALGGFLADLVVRGLLNAPGELERVRRSADALDAGGVLRS